MDFLHLTSTLLSTFGMNCKATVTAYDLIGLLWLNGKNPHRHAQNTRVRQVVSELEMPFQCLYGFLVDFSLFSDCPQMDGLSIHCDPGHDNAITKNE